MLTLMKNILEDMYSTINGLDMNTLSKPFIKLNFIPSSTQLQHTTRLIILKAQNQLSI